MVEKIIIGYSNIHRAPIKEDGSFDKPVRVFNGKKTSNKLNYESSQEWADDTIVKDSSLFAGGEGNTTFLGLSMDEYKLLFDHKRVKGGIAITSDDIPKTGAWLWERKKKGTNHRRLYCIYSTTCKPTGIDAETIEEGKAEGEEIEVEYTIGSYTHTDGKTYIVHIIDTDDPTVDQEMVANWFKEVQFPEEQVEAPTE